jgi:hypothetical protein
LASGVVVGWEGVKGVSSIFGKSFRILKRGNEGAIPGQLGERRRK